ncbi:formyltransferase family protein [Butyrivibrio sp. AD3002]|uniref:formyltransferase family protein n=1 Tax=Butyrivibrio sp. AD3002 TaxID=1280670 RepID=UPI0004088729|nr:formyltransferase family protein [Butyrivibrio sp. AD3002]
MLEKGNDKSNISTNKNTSKNDIQLDNTSNLLFDTDFRQIIVIGYGKVAFEIVKYLKKCAQSNEIGVEYIEYEKTKMSNIIKYCIDQGVNYSVIHDKTLLGEKLASIKDKALIVSAGNKFLFPASIIEKKNLVIINFHNAYLPYYPGRNAITWAIWNNEKFVGATWHYVVAGVDAGDIIWQRKIIIDENTKAYEAAGNVMKAALQGFEEIYPNLLKGNVASYKQQKCEKMNYSWMLPNGGSISIIEEPEKIYRLLRCFDYGLETVVGKVTIVDGCKEYEAIRYNVTDICNIGETVFENDWFHIPMNGRILNIKVRRSNLDSESEIRPL